jgi:hypothetical protein
MKGSKRLLFWQLPSRKKGKKRTSFCEQKEAKKLQ